MPQLKIVPVTWLGLAKLYKVVVDDGEVGRVGAKRPLTVDVPAGRHRVRVAFGKQSTRELDVDLKEGATATLQIRAPRRLFVDFRSNVTLEQIE